MICSQVSYNSQLYVATRHKTFSKTTSSENQTNVSYCNYAHAYFMVTVASQKGKRKSPLE